jgi:hypothetical protein
MLGDFLKVIQFLPPMELTAGYTGNMIENVTKQPKFKLIPK